MALWRSERLRNDAVFTSLWRSEKDYGDLDLPLKTSLSSRRGNITPTFSRSTTGTVTDFEGVIHTATIDELRFPGARRVENLLSYSEEFDNSYWTKTNCTITANDAYAPDGTLTADLFISTGGYSTIPVNLSVPEKECEFSLSYYIKNKDFTSTVQLLVTNSTSTEIYLQEDINLSDEWSRADTVFTKPDGVTTIRIKPVRSTSSSSAGSLWLWGSQIEKLSGTQTEASEYVSSGVLSAPYHGAGVDAVKYFITDREGNSLDTDGCLIEPIATNLNPYSVDFSSFITNSATITASVAVAPDGLTTASLVSMTAGSGFVYKPFTLTTGATYTYSVYLRSVSGTGTYGITLYYDGTLHRTNVTLTEEWQRFHITGTPTAAPNIYIYLGDDRVGTATLQQAYAWGAQLEAGTGPTSYIPTSGSSVTRTADVLYYDVEDAITQGQGSLYFEFKYDSLTPTYPSIISFDDGSDKNRISVFFVKSTKEVRCYVTYNESSIGTIYGPVTSEQSLLKTCIVYDNEGIRWFINGGLIGSISTANIPKNLTSLRLLVSVSTGNQPVGWIKNVKYYKKVLSGSQAIRMTS